CLFIFSESNMNIFITIFQTIIYQNIDYLFKTFFITLNKNRFMWIFYNNVLCRCFSKGVLYKLILFNFINFCVIVGCFLNIFSLFLHLFIFYYHLFVIFVIYIYC